MDQIAQSQIELNKKYGTRLIYIAWAIEIAAAATGLFIGYTNAGQGAEYFSEQEKLTGIAGFAFSNQFIATAPFFIIAAVELTKIPLALGFYRTKRLLWRSLFFFTLLLLIFVTFETLFNGMERNFSGAENKIRESRIEYQEKKDELANVIAEIERIETRTVEDIEEEYSKKILSLQEENLIKIRELDEQRVAEISTYRDGIKDIVDNAKIISDSSGQGQRIERLREDIKREEEKVEREISEISILIDKLNTQEAEEIKNKGVLVRAAPIRARYKEKIDLEQEKILNLRQGLVEYKEEKENILFELEESFVASQSDSAGTVDKSIARSEEQIDRINDIYSNRIEEANRRFESDLKNIQDRKFDLQNQQKTYEDRLPEFRDEKFKLDAEIVSLRTEIEKIVNANSVYSIATRLTPGKESAADLTKSEVSFVFNIWFGSIAFVAACVGVIVALAGFVLQDPESYRPILRRKRPILNSFRRLISSFARFYSRRKTGIIRHQLRGALLDLRKRLRAPKIKFKEIKIIEEVVKEVKVEVPGPEKIVYKEVPKEIIKKELVYVPLYSVEEGTVLTEKYQPKDKPIKDNE